MQRAMQPVPVLEHNAEFVRAPGQAADYNLWRLELQKLVQKLRAELPDGWQQLYNRTDLQWSSGNFGCYFAFLYDEELYDRVKRRWNIAAFLKRMRSDFCGIDSVVLWHAYPRIGLDNRNQFDFYRDMPGGLTGLRGIVRQFHAHGVKVFIDYNPWDLGTHREEHGDEAALADLCAHIEADGIFLDTMNAAPTALRAAVDSRRKGVLFEPEVRPEISELPVCTASWAQWFNTFPEPGLLLHKLIEPRHMQHQIRRWDADHLLEIETAFFNGSGMLIWENIFGSWNGWSAEDKMLWRRAVPILRGFSHELSSGNFLPYIPTLVPEVYANKWQGEEIDLYLITNRSGDAPRGDLLPLGALTPNDAVWDLWQGSKIVPSANGNVAFKAGRLSAIAVTHSKVAIERVQRFLRQTSVRLGTPPFAPRTAPVLLKPAPPASIEAGAGATIHGAMLPVPAGTVRMQLSHMRRECGCYPDASTTKDQLDTFLMGVPHDGLVKHDSGEIHLAAFYIDQHPVTNAQFERFVLETNYRPADATNFLKHWGGKPCPESLHNLPVVYVDLEDARAFAHWIGGRLPAEAEWHYAAQGADNRKWPWGNELQPHFCPTDGKLHSIGSYPQAASPFGCQEMTGSVWQWTESERSDGHTRSVTLRGGSFYKADGSIWYFPGGPQPLNSHAKMILMAPGLDRCATVGFRCVRDA